MKTLKQFVKENDVTMDVEYSDYNKNDPEWMDANHYKVTLKHNKKRFTTYFSQGYGIKGEPKPEDVLNCLASDSASIENARSFEEWAGEFGYDTDSRKSEKIYKVCQKQAEKIKALFGDDLYNELLFNTESL